jgi:hypothetical protein
MAIPAAVRESQSVTMAGSKFEVGIMAACVVVMTPQATIAENIG